ncbi:MAG TPA: acyltransferase family protein [Noviherbaspirillum sp.]|uniref:acyltransferase family protein n=1 Tax=Noviherbaspirillum sp. TaxID=1926288 RepID=UPI002D68834B|nr:acyltransferase family protein [Noviherbaspirillum sp.]HYD95936.1 acyltransferase family protein [Noviherbaspirillum sp.]
MPTTHFRILDLLKAVACNLIVLHHLAYYGPMTDYLRPLMPDVVGWFSQHARIAVHAFLTMGGFLAARSLAGMAVDEPLRAVWRRFVKLVPPYMAAICIAVAASALAARWMTHDSISAPPTLAQFAAHALLLQSILGYESLSAGAWYVAIDFQLFALLTLLLWLAGRGRHSWWLAPVLVGGCCAASLLVFNLDPAWDAWAPYFFGSYGLGALAWWAADRQRGPLAAVVLSGAILLLGGLALELEFRSRIAVALGTALLLVLACRGLVRLPGQNARLAAYLGRISYAVFLLHFPVSLVVNAAFTRFAPAQPEAQAAGVLLAWLASLAAGAAFHRWVEVPLSALADSARGKRPAQGVRTT